jgi:alginate O-acetyltransferase complex protein AlgI
MLFSSWQFILIFLPVSYTVYFWLNQRRLIVAGKAWLVLASLYFYSYWDVKYLPLILSSIMMNFAIGTGLAQSHLGHVARGARHVINRKVVLACGVVANLALLAYYKYADFFLENVNRAFGDTFPLPNIVLPLAISFFTFTQIAYLVDSYKGETAEYDLLNYALFVTFFPHLIAGPVVHHRDIMPQFSSRWTLSARYSNIQRGLFIFAIGLFKKVVIADTFAKWATAGFDCGQPMDFYSAWAASLSYTFQLYFDFSGYCDMAIGASLLFNIWLPINFNSPYKALNIQDFWRRWHITLSNFLRDYLYIPLGGNRKGEPRMYLNLFLTFVLGGLWHGATWMFVIWGALHGGALVVNRLWQQLGMKMSKPLAWLLTFLFVNFAWVFFRAKTWDSARHMLRSMIGFKSIFGTPVSAVPTEGIAWAGPMADPLLGHLPSGLVPYLPTYLAIMAAFVLASLRNSQQIAFGHLQTRQMVWGAMAFLIAMYFTLASTSSVFLYFNF